MNHNTYHAAMLFCAQLQADLKDQDLNEWAKSELKTKRICTTCKEFKPVSSFRTGQFYKGFIVRRYECIKCANEKYQMQKDKKQERLTIKQQQAA